MWNLLAPPKASVTVDRPKDAPPPVYARPRPEGPPSRTEGSAYSRATRSRRNFTLRLLAAFLAALGLIGAVQYVLEARAIRAELLEDRTADFRAEAAHIEKHFEEDGLTPTTLEDVAGGLKHIALRPGMRAAVVVDASGKVLATGDPLQIGKHRGSSAIPEAIRNGTVHSGIAPSKSGDVFEFVGPVDYPGGRVAFEAVADASVLDDFLASLRGTVLMNLLIGLFLGLPFFYLLGGRYLSGRYGAVELTQEERTAALDHTVRAAEEERSRLAAELHDGPIQQLSAIGYALERIRIGLAGAHPGGVSDELEAIREDIGSEVNGLRRMMTDLRPPALDERGLQAAILDSVQGFEQRSGIETTTEVVVPRRLDTSVETVLYRVVQEALTNVAKHSRARTARVKMIADNGIVAVEVSDDGIGFDVEQDRRARHKAHFGLALMRERIEIVGGRWNLSSSPSGTVVRAEIAVPARSS